MGFGVRIFRLDFGTDLRRDAEVIAAVGASPYKTVRAFRGGRVVRVFLRSPIAFGRSNAYVVIAIRGAPDVTGRAGIATVGQIPTIGGAAL